MSAQTRTRIVIIKWIQFKCTTILAVPCLVWICKIQNVGDAPSADDVIVTQQVTAPGVAVARAVHFVNEGPTG